MSLGAQHQFQLAMTNCWISASSCWSSGVPPMKPPWGMASKTCNSVFTPAFRKARCILTVFDRNRSRVPVCK